MEFGTEPRRGAPPGLLVGKISWWKKLWGGGSECFRGKNPVGKHMLVGKIWEGGNFHRGEKSGWETFAGGKNPRGNLLLGGKIQEGNFRWGEKSAGETSLRGKNPEGKHPAGGNFRRGKIRWGEISGGEKFRGWWETSGVGKNFRREISGNH